MNELLSPSTLILRISKYAVVPSKLFISWFSWKFCIHIPCKLRHPFIPLSLSVLSILTTVSSMNCEIFYYANFASNYKMSDYEFFPWDKIEGELISYHIACPLQTVACIETDNFNLNVIHVFCVEGYSNVVRHFMHKGRYWVAPCNANNYE